MIYMLTTSYPLASVSKVVELFLEGMKNPVPDYIERLGMYSTLRGEGIESYSFFKIEDGKVDEGLAEIGRRVLDYSSVDGYKVESKVVTSIEESLAIAGKEMP